MKHVKRLSFTLACITTTAIVLAGLSMPSLAFQKAHPASPSDATSSDATPGNAAPESAASPFEQRNPVTEEVYTVCGYLFWPYDSLLEWDITDPFDETMLSESIEVYLDGPEGHIEDSVEMEVVWDLSAVDFNHPGDYSVTGSLDVSQCLYPVNWDKTPPPAFTLSLGTDSILSFDAAVHGDTMTLSFMVDGESYSGSLMGVEILYESIDNGNTWHNITYLNRVQIFDDSIVIAEVSGNAMYQLTSLSLGDFSDTNSDIVSLEAGTVRIIPSGGEMGGDFWGEDQGKTWNAEYLTDGPYQILDYKAQHPGSLRPLSLNVPIKIGNEAFFRKENYANLFVTYGDRPDGFWSERLVLPVSWDFSPLDTLDWTQPGETVLHGSFSEETIKDTPLLDFSHMPELTLTISIYVPREDFLLDTRSNLPFEQHTLHLEFLNTSWETISFDDTSGLKVWCSIDGEMNWYDITAYPNVSIGSSTLSVSNLKDSYLRGYGYSFQIEQQILPDYFAFSSVQSVVHDFPWGIDFPDGGSGGDRGGGQRHDKPPGGLFDIEEEEETTEAPEETTVPPAETTVPPTETTSSPEESTPETTGVPEESQVPETTHPPTTEGAGSSDGDGSGNNGDEGNNTPQTTAPPSSANEPAWDETGSLFENAPASQAFSERKTGSVKKSRLSDAPPIPLVPAASAGAEVTPEADAKSEVETSPETETASEAETSPEARVAPENELEVAVVATGNKPSPRQLPLRAVIGITAVCTGGVAGFFMIRRR